MKFKHARKILSVLASLILIVFIGLGVLLIKQEMMRRRADVEYLGFQIMTGMVDQYNAGIIFNPSDHPSVAGFGLYKPSGPAVYRYGSAPEFLQEKDLNAVRHEDKITRRFGSSLIIVRQMGAMPPFRDAVPGMRGPSNRRMMRSSESHYQNLSTPGEMSSSELNPGNGYMNSPVNHMEQMGRYVFLELNIADHLRADRFFVLIYIVFFNLIAAAIILLVLYSRRIAVYRKNEQDNIHLIQLGEAARTLAHEIKNPLGVIKIQCATLSRTLPEDRQKNVAVIQEETERLTFLTDRVRDFLHNSEGTPKLCNASEFLEMCRVRYGEQLLVEAWKGTTVYVRIDPDRMMQVLDNLIVNALEASEIPERVVSHPSLSMRVQRNHLIFSVADRGTGILPENRGQLFMPFFTSKPRGSGIGLALSRRFMERAGGTLEYEERPGGGSIFKASLPVVSSTAKYEETNPNG